MNYYSPHTRYGSQLEEMLDEAYERFMTIKGGEVKQERKRSKRINTDADTYMLRDAGDCRVVLRNRGRAVELAKDHKPSCNSEKLRIENLGDIGRSPEITSVLKATKYTKELQSLLMEVHQLCDRSCPFTLADVVNKRHAPVSRISHSI